MSRSTPSPVSRFHSSARLALSTACALILTACNLPQATAPVEPTVNAMSVVPTTLPAEAASPPPSSATPPSGGDPIESELERYGISVIAPHPLETPERQAILDAVRSLALKTSSLNPQGSQDDRDRTRTFGEVFGRTVIRIYPERVRINGVHAALNCGWEGQFAAGCKLPEVYPEQDFPHGAWLILIGGDYLKYSTSDGGVGLVAHEIAHNLTWGGGHLPSNVGGFSYVRYVGDEFAIEYMDYLGVRVGRDAYVDDNARAANPRWRAELTADAIASWALGQVTGPDARMVNRYIQDMMACKIYGVGRC